MVRYAIPKREPLLVEHERFRDAVEGKQSDIVTLRQGLRTVQVAAALLESAARSTGAGGELRSAAAAFRSLPLPGRPADAGWPVGYGSLATLAKGQGMLTYQGMITALTRGGWFCWWTTGWRATPGGEDGTLHDRGRMGSARAWAVRQNGGDRTSAARRVRLRTVPGTDRPAPPASPACRVHIRAGRWPTPQPADCTNGVSAQGPPDGPGARRIAWGPPGGVAVATGAASAEWLRAAPHRHSKILTRWARLSLRGRRLRRRRAGGSSPAVSTRCRSVMADDAGAALLAAAGAGPLRLRVRVRPTDRPTCARTDPRQRFPDGRRGCAGCAAGASRGRAGNLVWDAHEYVPGLRPPGDARWLPAHMAHGGSTPGSPTRWSPSRGRLPSCSGTGTDSRATGRGPECAGPGPPPRPAERPRTSGACGRAPRCRCWSTAVPCRARGLTPWWTPCPHLPGRAHRARHAAARERQPQRPVRGGRTRWGSVTGCTCCRTCRTGRCRSSSRRPTPGSSRSTTSPTTSSP